MPGFLFFTPMAVAGHAVLIDTVHVEFPAATLQRFEDLAGLVSTGAELQTAKDRSLKPTQSGT